MAVFYDTGGGDIYGGPTYEAILKAMIEDFGDGDFDEGEVFEVDGSMKMNATDGNGDAIGELITIAEEYGDDVLAYCVCSDNV